MKNFITTFFAIAITAAFAAAAFADVKVRSKQTVGGQSYENTTFIKGKRQRIESIGGMVNITQCDLKRGVQINSGSQTYLVTPFAATTTHTSSKSGTAVTDKNGVVQTGGRITTTITTKDTGERKQMFGYTARRLIITMETISSADSCNKADSKMQTDGWYVDAAFALDCDQGMGGLGANYGKQAGCRDRYEMKTIGSIRRGFPIYERTTLFDASGRESFTMINEVVEFSQATLDAALFDVPSGYREISDQSQLYGASSAMTDSTGFQAKSAPDSESGLNSSIKTAPRSAAAETVGPKKAGVLRIGVPYVKSGPVGEGISSTDLAAAVRNTLMQKLNGQTIEVIALLSKVPSAISAEAESKECDFVANLTISHKKGGGFGMFKALAPVLGGVLPAAGSTVGTGGYIAGSVMQSTLTSSSVSSQMKNKDELTLDLKLDRGESASVLEKALKAKSRSNGEDIIANVVDQAIQNILAAIQK